MKKKTSKKEKENLHQIISDHLIEISLNKFDAEKAFAKFKSNLKRIENKGHL